ncbi:MAG: HNH endonuclease [Anaerolineae bacterium]|nr:HNH endonuclease [Anaerolineae bacterium]
MPNPSWQTIKDFVHKRANGCCEYCQTCEVNIGQTLHVEHINPTGDDNPDNLCLACPNCNLAKAAATTALDAENGEEVSLFNPRNQLWHEHFEWQDNHALIQGLTPIGRATVDRLKMNRPRIVLARKRWEQAGLHPVTKGK